MIIYKGYQVKSHKQFPAHKIIVTDGKGGKIPNILSGMFTSDKAAIIEIEKYLASGKKGTGNETGD